MFGSFIYTLVFPVPNNYISAFGTRTKLKCSLRIRSTESLLPSTHVSCAVSKWRMESFRKSFSSISLKSGDSRTEKIEQLPNVSIRWLPLLSGCSHYQDFINCIISNNSNTSNTSLFFQARLLDFLGDLIFWQ